MATFVRGRFGAGRVNAVALQRYRYLGSAEHRGSCLPATSCPSGLPSGLHGGIALTDGTIHHQDIRRALDLPRTIPPHRLVPVLNFALGSSTLPAKKHAKGLTLTATDVELDQGKWAAGSAGRARRSSMAVPLDAGRPSTRS